VSNRSFISGGSEESGVQLILDDGLVFRGRSFGACDPVCGEVVFNTAMSGYVETLTDPSYRGQILVATYPLIGNYGVPAPRASSSIDGPYESAHIQVQALVVQSYIGHYSHHAASRSLDQWLKTERVTGVTGVDTRALTRRLRERGTMKGWLVPDAMTLEDAKRCASSVDMKRDVFRLVAPPAITRYSGSGPTILLVDVGAKDQIARSLIERGATVVRVPWHAKLEDLLDETHGVVIGNGPGDPADLTELVFRIRGLLDSFDGPVFGICLGNQILALAAGGATYKLPYGHRGVNQPVYDQLTRRCFVTSQNHGYAVDDNTLPNGWEPWFVNVNDGTNEGVRCRNRPHFGVQFHPEARPGPEDTRFLFDDFIRQANRMVR
jgi:carbamoyl-phosphate synthase small subunit